MSLEPKKILKNPEMPIKPTVKRDVFGNIRYDPMDDSHLHRGYLPPAERIEYDPQKQLELPFLDGSFKSVDENIVKRIGYSIRRMKGAHYVEMIHDLVAPMWVHTEDPSSSLEVFGCKASVQVSSGGYSAAVELSDGTVLHNSMVTGDYDTLYRWAVDQIIDFVAANKDTSKPE